MSAPMSPERLAEIAARWGAVSATESPRLAVRDSSRPGVVLDALHHARTDVPALLAEVERLRAELAARVQCDDCGAIGDVAVGTDGRRHLTPSGEIGYPVVSFAAEQRETGGAS